MLAELVAAATARAEQLRPRRKDLERAAAAASPAPDFAAALRRRDVAVVAEVKRASPSRGPIRMDLDAANQAGSYAAGGAAAISILTEGDRFGGSLRDLETASSAVRIPVLRKDFIVSEEQLLEARVAGAAAALLIVRAIPPQQLRALIRFCREVAIEPVVEAHSAAAVSQAVDAGATVIGINARDLETLRVEPSLVARLAAGVPGDCVLLAESGLASRVDVERVAQSGVDAVLMGSSLSASDDPMAAVRALTGVARISR